MCKKLTSGKCIENREQIFVDSISTSQKRHDANENNLQTWLTTMMTMMMLTMMIMGKIPLKRDDNNDNK